MSVSILVLVCSVRYIVSDMEEYSRSPVKSKTEEAEKVPSEMRSSKEGSESGKHMWKRASQEQYSRYCI